MRFGWIGVGLLLGAVGCGPAETAGTGAAGGGGTGGEGASGGSTTTGGTGGEGASGGSTTTSAGGTGGSAGGAGGAGGAPQVSADALLALTNDCNPPPGTGLFATDDGEPDTIPVCGLTGAVFWKADMDIDCDGITTAACNLNTDPAYQPQTSTTDSYGDPLDASTLPFVVVPLPSGKFDYMAADIHLGGVVAVIYQGKLEFGIFGDEGPDNIIGEASYAMASLLGIDPDPATGGTDSGVTYIVFTGTDAVVTKNEDHQEAITLGMAQAATLLQQN